MRIRTSLAAAGLMAVSILCTQAQTTDDVLASRGEYLARAADCMPCHTGDKSTPYAGGLALRTPFGTMFSVNITSDPETAIGRWTYENFKNALHRGIRADGAYLYPAMPYDAYAQILEDDLKALWAYVRRIPPVKAVNRENELSFPFNIRMGMLAWRELFFAPAFFKATPGKSAEWNRGAYLAEALGHCSDCHSPRNVMGAVKGKAHFIGAEIDGFFAPDISSGALAKSWTKDSLVQFLSTGSVPTRTSVFGPMAEVVRNSLAYLTPADLNAMATYLLDSPPPLDVPAPQKLSPLPADVYKRAAKAYVDNCAGCHDAHGTGVANSVPPLAGNPAVTTVEPYNVIMAVLEGLPAGGSYGAMPSFAGRLSDEQIAELTNYVRTSWGNQAAPNATAEMIGAWRAVATVPAYGTEAAVSFDCPQVGGAPGTGGPDAAAVAAIGSMLQGSNRDIRQLIAAYRSAVPGADTAQVVNALSAAYCPVVAQSGAPANMKNAQLRRFALQVAANLSPRTAAISFPPVEMVWAVPAGSWLVAREPSGFTGKLSCPADDGKLVPTALVAKASALLGTPQPPVPGATAAQLASSFATQNAKSAPADIANALIAAYCRIVSPEASVTDAEKLSWLETFGDQVIDTLQLRLAARHQ